MWYAYIIRSINHPDQEYPGTSEDLKHRLVDHNAQKNQPTPPSLRLGNYFGIVLFQINLKLLHLRNILIPHPAEGLRKKAIINY